MTTEAVASETTTPTIALTPEGRELAAEVAWRASVGRDASLGLSLAVCVFAAACLGDLATYLTTAIQLAWAFPDPAGGFAASLLKFGGIFAITQIPLAISEGLLTVLVVNTLTRFNAQELQGLPLFAGNGGKA